MWVGSDGGETQPKPDLGRVGFPFGTNFQWGTTARGGVLKLVAPKGDH